MGDNWMGLWLINRSAAYCGHMGMILPQKVRNQLFHEADKLASAALTGSCYCGLVARCLHHGVDDGKKTREG